MKFSIDDFLKEKELETTGLELLPLCHLTTQGYFANILKTNSLEAHEKCPIYDELLVYFFYAKPSYIVDKEGLPNVTGEPPIALIYDFDSIKSFKRMLPFDSGGFDKYKFTKGIQRENFTVNFPIDESLRKLVKLIYDNNKDYLNNRVNSDNLDSAKAECFPVSLMNELYTNKISGLDVGTHAYSIELQTENIVDKDPEIILLPRILMQEENGFWPSLNFSDYFPSTQIMLYPDVDEVEYVSSGMTHQEYLRRSVKKICQGKIN